MPLSLPRPRYHAPVMKGLYSAVPPALRLPVVRRLAVSALSTSCPAVAEASTNKRPFAAGRQWAARRAVVLSDTACT